MGYQATVSILVDIHPEQIAELKIRELEIDLNSEKTKNSRLREALGLSLDILIQYEPPDSRAVSDEFVSMAMVSCDIEDEKTMEFIRESHKKLKERTNK